jgi:hypothetical protein
VCGWRAVVTDPVVLYGQRGAVEIAELEAALNARHDTVCDQLKPKYWPHMPMR